MADATKTLQIIIQAKDEATKQLQGFSKQLQDLSPNVKTLGIGLAALGVGAVAAGKSFVEAAGFVQMQRTAFRTLIGDVELAEKTYSDLVNFAAKTPFQIPEILEQSKRLLAMGTEAKDLTKTFGMLGDVASGVGMEKLPQLVLAFGQIQAKGRLMGTELRQLTEAGFNLADAMGISNEKLDQLVTDKAVKFEDVRKAFESVTGEGGRFHGLMEQLNQTTPGQISNLSDNFFKLKAALGDALVPAVNTLLEALIPLVQQFALFAKDNPQLVVGITALALILGTIGTVLLVVGPIVAGFTGLVSLLSGAITFATTVITTIVGILGGPLTLIILAVMALVALFTLAWKNNWFGIRDVVNNVVVWFKDTAVPWIKQAFETVKSAVKSIHDFFVDKFNAIKAVINSVIDAISNLINKAKQVGGSVAGAAGLKFQHGGFVPGGSGDAVPAILHGGERVVPRTGMDVNNGGGGGMNVSLNFTGAISLDNESRVQELADKISDMLSRQNELASKGVYF